MTVSKSRLLSKFYIIISMTVSKSTNKMTWNIFLNTPPHNEVVNINTSIV